MVLMLFQKLNKGSLFITKKKSISPSRQTACVGVASAELKRILDLAIKAAHHRLQHALGLRHTRNIGTAKLAALGRNFCISKEIDKALGGATFQCIYARHDRAYLRVLDFTTELVV